ncbi:MAG: choice-of-anchor Q domain-containing protein [Kiritimatiellia bacterium]
MNPHASSGPSLLLRRLRPALLLVPLVVAPPAASAYQAGYAYDDAGRLLQADYGGGQQIDYVYDANGNLLVRSAVSTNGAGPFIRYVRPESPTPAAPFLSLETAGHDIQSVVDACDTGDVVKVFPGIYATGGRAAPGSVTTNRVYAANAIRIESMEGPGNTIIVGASDAGEAGPSAVRCVHLAPGSVLAGFTLTNGATQAVGGDDGSGGGAVAIGSVVTNCVVADCIAQMVGGGIQGGIVYNSVLFGNYALFGGGAVDAELHACILYDNGAQGGAAANNCDLINGLLFHNGATLSAGGAQGGTLVNCTVVANQTAEGGGGGVNMSTLLNCIVVDNVPENCIDVSNVHYSCTAPLPVAGIGNLDATPGFVDAAADNYRLAYGSPCLDAGSDQAGAPDRDLDGRPRPLDGNWDLAAVRDMGAYEYDPDVADSNGDGVPDSWYHRHGLNAASPTIGGEHGDDDPFTNADEYAADTDPTNAASFFRILDIDPGPPAVVTFDPGSAARLYTFQFTEDLLAGGWSNVPGTVPRRGAGGIDSMQDAGTLPARSLYRLQVEVP